MTESDEEPTRGAKGSIWRPRAVVVVVLGFWAVWWSLVFTTNLFDGLIRMGVLGDGWTFASGNYGYLVEITSVHNTPDFVVAVLFAGGVAWELAVAVLMWLAFSGYIRGSPSRSGIYRAFVPAVGFFSAFLVLTEVFIAYSLADTVVRLFVAVLVSVFVIEYLGEWDTKS